MSLKGLAVVSAILFVFAVSGFAQQSNPPGDEGGNPPGTEQSPQGKGHFIQKFDKDNDGKVSKEEFTGPAEHFTRMDKNGDGFISADEVKPGNPPRLGGEGPQGMGQHFFRKFDKDKDGKVSKEEFTGRSDRFTGLDKNGDGFVTADEMPEGPQPQKQGQQN